ncbi:T9SS type A sorting domain-containing protein [Lacinutrix sp. WUR7]|uniref:T9SS type A sorting domain-containing protein n=1 Tax=Lacinutrix sp. WUR7 TaxID=2653681 RepID=UPI00193D2BB2|nr:T9SS type A sorting domain-containing protein [Lacinutrix sp. WUR7]QRM88368.1 T9SS type A sorting domain-containing protein [Lacinutrix sp. WUR7]
MKKTLLFMAIVVAMQLQIQAQSTAVPNTDFEQFLVDFTTINGPVDGFILDSEAAAVTGILSISNTAPYNAINDFTGIEALTGITGLVITYNSAVTSLDVSANTNLTMLNTEGSSSLSSIVIGASNTTLSEFRIPGCPVGSLDLSGNTGLTVIDVRLTGLSTLDLSTNGALVSLACSFNSLTELDMRNGNNANVTAFDARSNTSLVNIFVDDCTAGYLTALPWQKDGTSSFVNDATGCPTLSIASETELAFDVYPNPAKNRIYVTSNLQESQIQVYDITGKLVLSKDLSFGKNAVDISAMAPGVYLARIFAGGKSQTKKLIIQ